MAVRLKIVDRETPMMLPPDIREWIPKDCIVLFIIEAVALMGLKGFVGGISVDGTKIKANASKLEWDIYKKAGKMIQQLELEVEELIKKAEDADFISRKSAE